MADPPEQRDLVRLEAHARPAPVPQAATGQLVSDIGGLDRKPGRKALEDHDEGAPVGLASSQKAQHNATLPDCHRHSGAVGTSRAGPLCAPVVSAATAYAEAVSV